MKYKKKQNTTDMRIYKIATIILIAIFIVIVTIDKIKDNKMYKELEVLQENDIKQMALEKADMEYKENKIKETIPGIVCWGDSLTAGAGGNGVTYPNVLSNLINENIYDIPVFNMGVGGENTRTILGRAGAIPYVVDEFTIPSDTSRVKINLKSINGQSVGPLKQGDKALNPVTINGIKGIIELEDEEYFFRRAESGESIEVKHKTQVITSGTDTYKDYINIIFIGQNGGWDNIDSLISQQNSIINKLDKNKEQYLIIGLTSGTAKERSSLENAMVEEYGDKYINLRLYLSKYGLDDAGLEATSEDLKYMNEGRVPPSLLSDTIHFNNVGYKLIGEYIYKRMIELGYFDSIEKYLS